MLPSCSLVSLALLSRLRYWDGRFGWLSFRCTLKCIQRAMWRDTLHRLACPFLLCASSNISFTCRRVQPTHLLSKLLSSSAPESQSSSLAFIRDKTLLSSSARSRPGGTTEEKRITSQVLLTPQRAPSFSLAPSLLFLNERKSPPTHSPPEGILLRAQDCRAPVFPLAFLPRTSLHTSLSVCLFVQVRICTWMFSCPGKVQIHLPDHVGFRSSSLCGFVGIPSRLLSRLLSVETPGPWRVSGSCFLSFSLSV